MIAGAAFTAVGAAGLKMVDSAKEMNAQLGVTALNLGVSSGRMRELALETTNVTFPLKEVTASFDLLARAGVKDTEVLRDTATAFDTLGDAVGMSASDVTARMVPAMKTFGLNAIEVADKTDLMTNLVRNSTVSLDNFGSVIGYITPELVEMGLTIEDTVALMAIMEGKGMSGEVATRAFRTAITQATREQIPLQEALGITSEEMDTYKSSLEGIDGMTQKYADVANTQYGIMDKIKQKFDELTLSAGTFLTPLEPILATMTAMGPVMIALSTNAGVGAVKWGLHTAALIAHKVALVASTVAIKAVTAAQWLWNAAMIANPIGLIITAIGALVAAGVLLWKNWDKVTAKIKEIWKKIWGVISDFGKRIKNFFKSLNPWEWMKKGWNALRNGVKGVLDKIFGHSDVEDWFYNMDHWLKSQNLEPAANTMFDTFKQGASSKLDEINALIQSKMATAGGGWTGYYGFSEPESKEAMTQKRLMAWYGEHPGELPPEGKGLKELVGFGGGGIAMRPMIARVAEREPEVIAPISEARGLLGPQKVNIYIEMDGRIIAKAIGQPMVDEIRLRTGMRM